MRGNGSLKSGLKNLLFRSQGLKGEGEYFLFPDPESDNDFFMAGRFVETDVEVLKERYGSESAYWERFDSLQKQYDFC